MDAVQQEINATNWNICSYKSGTYQAIVSIGAAPDLFDDEFIYFVTVLENDEKEVFQKEFQTIHDACGYINERYADMWTFTDRSISKHSDDGCSTCVAH